MVSTKPTILIIEDDEAIIYGYKSYLIDSGFEVDSAFTLKEADSKIKSTLFDAILLDLKLPDGNSLYWIVKQKTEFPDVPIIVITGVGDIPTAVQATKNGAADFLSKPIDMEVLKNILDKSIEQKVLRSGKKAQQPDTEKNELCFGTSTLINNVLDLAKLATANTSIVLLQGETGTGKGVLAKWIHNNSQRKSEPFVDLNCAALKGELLQSELFGHTRGAFTSAIQDHEGLFEIAHNGTLFLDEIGEMDMEVQIQLLKTIENKVFRRIGENKTRTSNFRLICATNRDIIQDVKNNKFRSDLFYRIFVFPITLPPLRYRREDIPILTLHFLKQFGYTHFPLEEEIMSLLKSYNWPGNVRELRNVLERILVLAQGEPLLPGHFNYLVADSMFVSRDYSNSCNLKELSHRHILNVLDKHNNDLRAASMVLGISVSNLYRKLQLINKEKNQNR